MGGVNIVSGNKTVSALAFDDQLAGSKFDREGRGS